MAGQLDRLTGKSEIAVAEQRLREMQLDDDDPWRIPWAGVTERGLVLPVTLS